MAVNLSPVGGVAAQFFDNDGNVLSGGKIYTYSAGTNTPQTTFTTGAGNIPHANPIILDSAGRVPTGEIWLTDGSAYKFVIKDANDTLIGTYDNIVGINSNFINFLAEQEIQTATAGQTVFTLTTTQYQPGTNTLSVYVDGVNQYGPGAQYAYTETSSTVVTFNSGLHVGAEVKFTTSQTLSGGTIDSSQVSYDPPYTGSVVTNVEDKLSQYVSAFDFLPSDQIAFIKAHNSAAQNASIVTSGLQDALETGKVVFMPVGTYKTNSPLIISRTCRGFLGEIFGDGDGTRIDYYGSDAAIKLYDATSGTRRVTQARVENIAIRVQNSGVNGIDFTDASYCTFRDLFIRLLASNQNGIYGVGNGQGSSPYYNIFDGIKIFGNANNVTYPNQKGYFFQGDASGNASNGPNANMISNGGQLGGLSHGVHIQSGTGNVFSNMIMESIAEYAYRFGLDTSPAPGRADQNSVVNHWMEGTSTCVFARFEGDAAANTITNYSINSVSPIAFDNQSTSNNNFCKPAGNMYVASFYGTNIPANATTALSPTNSSGPSSGGVIVPFSGMIPYLLVTTVQGFASGGLGSGVVQAYRSGLANPNLTFTVNNANRFGGTTRQYTPNSSLAYNTFDGTVNSQIEVAITTDASWNQSSADVHVQVIFFG